MIGTNDDRPWVSLLSVLLTGRCNLDCSYCYRGGSGGRDLDESALNEALTMALQAAGPKLEIHFSGGEPALRFDVFRAAVARVRAEAPGDRQVTLRLASNGTLLSDERLDFLVEQDVYLSLSLDGTPQAQRLRGADTVVQLDQLLERLRRRHPDYLARRIRAVMTLLPVTVGQLAEAVDRSLGAGLREIHAAPALTPVPGWDDDLRADLAVQLTAVRRLCEGHLAATGEIPFLPLRHFYAEPAPEEGDDAESRLRLCAVHSGSAPVLDTDGRLYACLMFAPSGMGAGAEQEPLRRAAAAVDLGRPGEPGLARRAAGLQATLAELPGFVPQRQLSSRFGACATCEARRSCSVCPFARLRCAGTGDATRVPAFHCAFNREIVRQRQLIPAQPAEGPTRCLPEVIDERRRRFLAAIGLSAVE